MPSTSDEMTGSLYVIDALNFLFRAFHALPPLVTRAGVPTGAIYGLCQMLFRIEREYKPSHICVAFDAPGRTFRDDLFKDYKAHRPPMPPELVAQIALTHRVIEAFGLPVLSIPGVEADDVIATLALQAADAGLRVVICSSDKDLMQLCDGRIEILDTMKNRVIGPAEVKEKFGVFPERLGDVLALMGDSVDNVPGVAGIGPKTAADLINTYGSLDQLLARLSEVKGKKGETLAASRDAIDLSRKLVALKHDVDLGRSLSDLRRAEPDRVRLADLFRELEFSRLLAEVASKPPAEVASPSVATVSIPLPPAQTSLDFSPVTPPALPAAPVTIVREATALAGLAAALMAASDVGIAAASEGEANLSTHVVGIAFALPSGARFYVPAGHRLLEGPPSLKEAEVLAALGPALAADRPRKHLHDSKSIEVPLLFQGVQLGGVESDTLLGAYLLDASRTRHDLDVVAAAEGIAGVVPRTAWLGTGKKARVVAEIACEAAAAPLAAEAAATLALARVQRGKLNSAELATIYDTMELPLAHVLARVERHGIRLDTDALRRLGHEVATSIAALEAEIHALAGVTFNIGSPKQLADVLFSKLGLPVVRKTKTGASTDADVLEELAAHHAVPAKIVEYRTLTKLKGTYIDALPALVSARTGRLHTTFNQAVAATGRLSSSDPNLQNIPIRTDLGRRIRQAFIADPGFRLVSADYSQIELRVLAHFSADPAFVDAFYSGQDIHRRTAAEVFGIALLDVSAEQRRIAKAINFGLVFGQTEFGLAQALRIPRSQARAYIESYFARYAGVRDYMEGAITRARADGAVTTLLGRRRAIPELLSSRAQERAYGERIARNTPIQGSAADILKLAMIRVDAGLSAWPETRLLLTVHDELVFEVKESAVDGFAAWVKHEMESVHTLRVPLVVDVGSGHTWSEAH